MRHQTRFICLVFCIIQAASAQKIPKSVVDLLGTISASLKELLPPELNPDYTAPPPKRLLLTTPLPPLLWGGGRTAASATPPPPPPQPIWAPQPAQPVPPQPIWAQPPSPPVASGSHIFGPRQFNLNQLFDVQREAAALPFHRPTATPSPIGPQPPPPLSRAPETVDPFVPDSARMLKPKDELADPMPFANLPVISEPQEVSQPSSQVFRSAGSFVQAFPADILPAATAPPHRNPVPAAAPLPPASQPRPPPAVPAEPLGPYIGPRLPTIYYPPQARPQAPVFTTPNPDLIEFDETASLLESLAAAARIATQRMGGTLASDVQKYASEATQSALKAAQRFGFPTKDIDYLTQFAIKAAKKARREEQAKILAARATTTTVADTTPELTTTELPLPTSTAAFGRLHRLKSKKAAEIRRFRSRRRQKLLQQRRKPVNRDAVFPNGINTNRFLFLSGQSSVKQTREPTEYIHEGRKWPLNVAPVLGNQIPDRSAVNIYPERSRFDGRSRLIQTLNGGAKPDSQNKRSRTFVSGGVEYEDFSFT